MPPHRRAASIAESEAAVYMDRDFGMYDLQGQQVGECTPDASDDYDCTEVVPFGLRIVRGGKKFHCTTYLTAQEINDAAQSRTVRVERSTRKV